MDTFYFTFGLGHALSDKFQPIVASSFEQARGKMVGAFGSDWAFGYTQVDFQQSMENGYFLRLNPLKPIYSKEAV